MRHLLAVALLAVLASFTPATQAATDCNGPNCLIAPSFPACTGPNCLAAHAGSPCAGANCLTSDTVAVCPHGC
jgi:hypothetical protein